MQNRILKTVALGLVSLSLASCATLISGKTQKINVSSFGKENVKFEIDGRNYKTPAIVTVERENKDKVIRVLDENCYQKEVLVNKKFNLISLLNFLVPSGLFGLTTDYSTGAMWEYDNNVHINCK